MKKLSEQAKNEFNRLISEGMPTVIAAKTAGISPAAAYRLFQETAAHRQIDAEATEEAETAPTAGWTPVNKQLPPPSVMVLLRTPATEDCGSLVMSGMYRDGNLYHALSLMFPDDPPRQIDFDAWMECL